MTLSSSEKDHQSDHTPKPPGNTCSCHFQNQGHLTLPHPYLPPHSDEAGLPPQGLCTHFPTSRAPLCASLDCQPFSCRSPPRKPFLMKILSSLCLADLLLTHTIPSYPSPRPSSPWKLQGPCGFSTLLGFSTQLWYPVVWHRAGIHTCLLKGEINKDIRFSLPLCKMGPHQVS